MERSNRRRMRTALVGVAAMALIAAGCGGDGGDDSGSASGDDSGVTLTMYTDQHAELIEGLTAAYTAETGVRFDIQNGATVGQIEAEGAASRADVFLSEDPGPAAPEGLLGGSPLHRGTARLAQRNGAGAVETQARHLRYHLGRHPGAPAAPEHSGALGPESGRSAFHHAGREVAHADRARPGVRGAADRRHGAGHRHRLEDGRSAEPCRAARCGIDRRSCSTTCRSQPPAPFLRRRRGAGGGNPGEGGRL